MPYIFCLSGKQRLKCININVVLWFLHLGAQCKPRLHDDRDTGAILVQLNFSFTKVF